LFRAEPRKHPEQQRRKTRNNGGRQYYLEFTNAGGTLDNIQGFTSYMNFLSQKTMLSDKENLQNAKVEFSENDISVIMLYDKYKELKSECQE